MLIHQCLERIWSDYRSQIIALKSLSTCSRSNSKIPQAKKNPHSYHKLSEGKKREVLPLGTFPTKPLIKRKIRFPYSHSSNYRYHLVLYSSASNIGSYP